MRKLLTELALLMTRIAFYLRFAFQSNITTKGGIRVFRFRLRLHGNALLSIGRGVTLFRSSFDLSPGSHVEIADGAIIKNARIVAGPDARIKLAEHVVLRYNDQQGVVQVEAGTLEVSHHANLACDINLRFGSMLRIGAYTGIGSRSEIVCDREISIGNYGLFSTDVDIYDTNSHSTDHQRRRDRIEAGYPVGCSEVEPPDTDPIRIGDDVWIGKRSAVLKGAIIGNRCVVGMGTRVTAGNYPEGAVIVSEKPRVIGKNQ